MSTTANHPHHHAAAAGGHGLPDGWWAAPLIYSAAVYVAAALLPAVVLWQWVAAAAALAVLGCCAARAWIASASRWHGRLPAEAALLGVVAGLAHGAWWVWLSLHAARPLDEAGVLALIAAATAGWWATIGMRVPAAAAAMTDTPATAEAVAAAGESDRWAPWPEILRGAGVTGVRVIDVIAYRGTGDDGAEVDTVVVEPDGGTGGRQVTFARFASHVPNILTEAARVLRGQGVTLLPGDVRAITGRDAFEYRLVVTRKHLSGVVPFRLAPAPTPWCGPKRVGVCEDMTPVAVTLFCDERRGGVHGEVLGAFGSGKGGTLKTVIGRAVESNEGEVWVVGTFKVFDLVVAWLVPFMRDGLAPAIDRVGGPDVMHALELLADAYEYSVRCNAAKTGADARRPTPEFRALTLILDESSDLLEHPAKISTFDGRLLTASELVSLIRKGGRSAPVTVISANQDNLFGSGGKAGAKAKRNGGNKFVLRVEARHDATQALGPRAARLNPMELRDNMMFLNPVLDDAPELPVKADYIEEADVPAVAAAVADRRGGLEPTLLAGMRWQHLRWSANRHPELVAYAAANGWAWPGGLGWAPDARSHPGGPPAGAGAGDTPSDQGGRPPAHQLERAVRLLASSCGEDPASWLADLRAGTLDPTLLDVARQIAGSLTRPAPAGGGDTSPPEETDMPDRSIDLPTGWHGAGFDVMAALSGDAQPDTSPPDTGRPIDAMPVLDGSDLRAIGADMTARERARVAKIDVPDPLGIVCTLMMKDGAPEWVSTETLAVALGRTTQEAPDADRRRAAEQLGRDLRKQDPALESQQRRVEDGRSRGYLRSALLEAGRRVLEADA